MKTKFLTLICLSLLCATACDNNKQAQNKLQSDVIITHDMVMAKMDKLNESKYQLDSLKARFWNLKNAQPQLDTLILEKTIDSLKLELTNADEAMMDWMRNFNPDYGDKTHEEIMSYLNGQKTKIDSVNVLFETALSKSDEIVVKYK